jgi:hypothetical protein
MQNYKLLFFIIITVKSAHQKTSTALLLAVAQAAIPVSQTDLLGLPLMIVALPRSRMRFRTVTAASRFSLSGRPAELKRIKRINHDPRCRLLDQPEGAAVLVLCAL